MGAEEDAIGPEERNRLFARFDGQLLALCVSGGADSMALMHLVADWARDRASPSAPDGRLPVIVLTVDHGLRPASGDEARFVAAEASKLGLRHHTLQWTDPKPETGIQEAARHARRRLLREHVEAEAGCSDGCRAFSKRVLRVLVMAHHLGDQAETFMMRLARGSGLEGLAGMAADGYVVGGDQPVALARPFLGVSPGRLRATLAARSAVWIEDPSNADDRFERVRVRKALSVLAALGVATEKIALSARRLGDAAALIGADGPQLAGLRSVRSSTGEKASGVAFEGRHGLFGVLALGPLMGARRHLGVRAFSQLLASFGGASLPADLSQIEELVEWVCGMPSGQEAARTLGGCKVVCLGDVAKTVKVFREGGALKAEPYQLCAGETVAWDGGRFIASAAHASGTLRALGGDGWSALKRTVPELGALKLSAAGMATCPAFFDRDQLLACPPLDAYIADATDQQRVQTAWAAAGLADQKGFGAVFYPARF